MIIKREILPGENMLDARRRWEAVEKKMNLLERAKDRLKLEKAKAKTEERRLWIREEMQKLEQLEMENLNAGKPKIRLPKRPKKIQILPEPIIMPPPVDYISGDKKLSILICSIVGREVLLQKLIIELEKQATDDVEILVEVDNKIITIGAKRNILLKRARGDYICFVDDDDKISDNYVIKILKAIESKPDCCSLKGLLKRKISRKQSQRMRRREIRIGGVRVNTFIHSLQYKSWFERKGIYYRCPNHLNAVRRELALKIGFPDVSKGEDSAYSLNLFPLLKKESVIDGTIYFYENVL